MPCSEFRYWVGGEDAVGVDWEAASMARTVEGFIADDGSIHLLEPVALAPSSRVLVTILDVPSRPDDVVRLAEAALSDWDRPEEDAAWAHLQER